MENYAAEQLAAVASARAAAADLVVAPSWFHLAFGLASAAAVAGVGFSSYPVQVVIGVVYCAVIYPMLRAYRERAGVRLSGPFTGRPRWWALGTGLLFGQLFAFAQWSSHSLEARWHIPVLALAAFAVIVVGGRGFDDALRAQLRSEP